MPKDKRQPTYRKIVDCPDCGVTVKVPAGQTFAQAHACDPRPRRRRTQADETSEA